MDLIKMFETYINVNFTNNFIYIIVNFTNNFIYIIVNFLMFIIF